MAMGLIVYVVLITRSCSGKFTYALLVQGKLRNDTRERVRADRQTAPAQAGRGALDFGHLVTPWFLS